MISRIGPVIDCSARALRFTPGLVGILSLMLTLAACRTARSRGDLASSRSAGKAASTRSPRPACSWSARMAASSPARRSTLMAVRTITDLGAPLSNHTQSFRMPSPERSSLPVSPQLAGRVVGIPRLWPDRPRARPVLACLRHDGVRNFAAIRGGTRRIVSLCSRDKQFTHFGDTIDELSGWYCFSDDYLAN